MKRALLSVSAKAGLEDLGRSLNELGYELFSTGGTARALAAAGIPVREVSDLTGTPEVLDGRVKTLHPRVFASLLADLDLPAHRQVLSDWDLTPISLLVVNLYPFAATAANPHATPEELIENIDIGGPSLIRAAAKNHGHVTVVVDPADYPRVIAALSAGEVPLPLRRELAVKAFRHTAAYDATIASVLPARLNVPDSLGFAALAPWIAGLEEPLRYGENPHQSAVLLRPASAWGLAAFRQHQGKELSYNNLQDADAAWRLVWDLPSPGVAIVKHATPCGVGLAATAAEAYRAALACDRMSAFGGVIASRTEVDEDAARAMIELFAEVVVAPSFTTEARVILGSKKGLRVLTAPPPGCHQPRLRAIDGGLLIQAPDESWDENWQVVTARQPDDVAQRAMVLAWRVAKHTLSNAIVIANDHATLGIGGGQPNRVDAARMAIARALANGLSLEGAAAGSDAFFPFPDGVETLAAAGITAIVQPGGSVRDGEVIAAADRLGISMTFTGRRHFRH